VSGTVIRQVLDGGLAVLASDVRGNPQLEDAESIQRFRIRSVMCVPLGQPVRGLIYLDNRSARPFTPADLEFLTAAARYASLVLRSAEEHLQAAEALQLSGERLEMLQGELLRHEIVGTAPSLLRAYDALRRFARSGARVLLRGETGTGKELFARAYAANSPRPGSPYVPVPIPALAPTVVESELFGHVRGSFTEAIRDKKGRLELADRGVLFLDEVGDIEPHLQTKLLRFLDSGELYRVGDTGARHIDALVVSATNRPLEKDVQEGRFRADLLARLGHVIEVPPLRERREDVPRLVAHFLARYDRGPRRKSFAPDALAVLQAHHWPFNVRELQQVVERAVCLVDGDVIGREDLPEYLRSSPAAASTAAPSAEAGPPGPLRRVVEEAEKAHILRALEYTKGNRRRAIELLQLSPETFYRRLEEYGLHKKGTPE
jgi:DNA-binding NtrC family response regulator